jgi:hypothetical protein
MMELPGNFGVCPYCGSSDAVKGSRITAVQTRNTTYKCKDCNHTFSYGTYFNKKTEDIRVDTHLSDLQLYGLIEKTGEDTFTITDTGKKLITEHKAGKQDMADRVITSFPLWKDLSEKLPMHPTKEMFFKALHEVLKEDTPNKSKQEWLWNRYNVEVIPALERKARCKKYYGYIGITLYPHFASQM